MSYRSVISTGEEFLRDFHREHAGLTARLLQPGHDPQGKSSYRRLADAVAGADRVLDLGCGDGALLALLAGDGVTELAGIDLSEDELALARQRPELAGATLVHGRAQQLPFPADSFDAVTAHMAFMLMAEPAEVAEQVARVLVPGGRLALVLGGGPRGTGAFPVFREQFAALFGDLPTPPRLGDRRTRDRAGLDELLGPAGFAPVDWQELTLDLSGPLDQVWAIVSGVYHTLDADQLATLRAAFNQTVTIGPDGIVPATTTLILATTTLRSQPAGG